MSRTLRRILIVGASAGLLAACATREQPPVSLPPSAGVYKIGKPYQIAGTWYYPREQPDYDETGIASWYGPTFYGKRTADGEIFDANALSAAHRTLPLPVNVRVTDLENGRSLIVRVNDRGPFAKGRIIDLSERAAKLLGFYGKGTARVRVTYIGRADQPNGAPQPDQTPTQIASALPAVPAGSVDVRSLASIPGTSVTAPPPAPAQPPPQQQTAAQEPDQLPNGQVTEVPVPAVTRLYIQAGAFSSYDNARRMAQRLSAAGVMKISSIDRNGLRLYRVRMGPFNDVASADAALSRVLSAGSSDAAIVVDR
ncbi:MAG: septal ring lytic transglycosylase RlpA family protein [Alphaproteobacteria bacterium]|nr:septal ring lytic transglycosylase RlpA family protein [Alphaproteobacteria bacterium]MDE2011734.1 septal ring lytic transglycosylase RlpA family protein [Alphaproteobacteria bacterium]MDE2072970.1 septal ring lytic transglycosylase RlpA family protein [Alphaproteobacteria bacterium]MDE2351826.1 septal ring lytic transglycosylase RlpA family protein [Alphaproteobacteria bacterium]